MNYFKPILAALVMIIIAFVAISIFDVVISIFSRRFYSTAAFITIFGVGGVFAAFYSYSAAMSFVKIKNNVARWVVVITILFAGALFFFLLARMEGGEYEPAFKAFGVTLALTSLFLGKTKIDI